jgi:hypothetical protein
MDKFIYEFDEATDAAMQTWWLALESGLKTFKVHPAALMVQTLTGQKLIIADMVTTGDVTLSGIQNIDGQSGGDGKVVLVWKNSDLSENGVWIMHGGAWTRHPDADEDTELNNQEVFANYAKVPGVLYGTFYFTQTEENPVPDSDDVIYQISKEPGRIAVPYNKVRVDRAWGNDTLGEKYRFNKPYKSVEAAMAVAVAGDTVEVYPHPLNYDIGSNIAKQGVTLEVHYGAGLQKYNAGPMFDLTALTGSFTVRGAGNFLHLVAANSVFYANNVGVAVDISMWDCTAIGDAISLKTTSAQRINFRDINSSAGKECFCMRICSR